MKRAKWLKYFSTTFCDDITLSLASMTNMQREGRGEEKKVPRHLEQKVTGRIKEKRVEIFTTTMGEYISLVVIISASVVHRKKGSKRERQKGLENI